LGRRGEREKKRNLFPSFPAYYTKNLRRSIKKERGEKGGGRKGERRVGVPSSFSVLRAEDTWKERGGENEQRKKPFI